MTWTQGDLANSYGTSFGVRGPSSGVRGQIFIQILPQSQPQRRAAMRLEGRGPWMQIAAELACCYYSTSVHNRAGKELAKFAGQTSTGHPHVC